MIPLTSVLVKPIVTEKSNDMKGKYVFQVHPDASKEDVVKAVKAFYNIDVEKVNISKLPPKLRMIGRGRNMRKRSETKKAIVTTKNGATLEFNAFK